MADNKVIIDGETIIDLTEDTATEDSVLEGYTFHDASGEKKTGRASGGGTGDYEALENKPSINGVELVGNKTTEDLKIETPSDYTELDNKPSINGVELSGNKSTAQLGIPVVEVVNNLTTQSSTKALSAQQGYELNSKKYTKPNTGIPLSDLSQAVQTSIAEVGQITNKLSALTNPNLIEDPTFISANLEWKTAGSASISKATKGINFTGTIYQKLADIDKDSLYTFSYIDANNNQYICEEHNLGAYRSVGDIEVTIQLSNGIPYLYLKASSQTNIVALKLELGIVCTLNNTDLQLDGYSNRKITEELSVEENVTLGFTNCTNNGSYAKQNTAHTKGFIYFDAKLATSVAVGGFANIGTYNSASVFHNKVSIPVMVMSASDIPVGVGTVLMANGNLYFTTNIAVSSNYRIRGSACVM